MRDSAGKGSARPSTEISQGLSHVIGGFPGKCLPRVPLIHVIFLKSSDVHMAISHPSPDLSTAVLSGVMESCQPSRAALGHFSWSLNVLCALWFPWFLTCFNFLLEYSCFIMLLVSAVSKLNQLYLDIYPFFLGFSSYLGHHRALGRVPCAI